MILIQYFIKTLEKLFKMSLYENQKRVSLYVNPSMKDNRKYNPQRKLEFAVPLMGSSKIYVYGISYAGTSTAPQLELYQGLKFWGYLNILDPRKHQLSEHAELENILSWVEEHQIELINFEVHKDFSQISSLVKVS